MTAAIPATAVGVFRDRKKAEKAVEDLVRSGFSREQVELTLDTEEKAPGPPLVEGDRATEGGTFGVYAGGLLGGLIGLIVGLVPGISIAVGFSLVACAVLGLIGGMILGSLIGQLAGARIRYQPEPGDSGADRYLVEVQANGRYEDAVEVLRSNGARGRGSPLV